ncbi:MAG: LamG-like jellyroll fold domain-containing protein [Thermodesulfobacteriota bacterium]
MLNQTYSRMSPFKKIVPLLVLLVLSLAPICGAEEGCPAGMMAYWQLEEVTDQPPYADAAGVNDGTCELPGNCPSRVASAVVGAGQFFDTNGGITVAPNTAFDWEAADSFTVELWMKRSATGLSGEEVLIARDDLSNNMQWWIGIQGTGEAVFELASTDGGTRRLTSSKRLNNGDSFDRQNWHHIVAVRDAIANQNRLYVDGQLEAQVTTGYSGGFASTAPLTMGHMLENGSPAYHYGGYLDEVALHSAVLSEDEIRRHYFLAKGYCRFYDSRVRIMPLGDSITYDRYSGDNRLDGERTGYRWPLYIWLENYAYWVDFVGSENAGYSDTVSPPFDTQNAGFPGINDEELARLMLDGYNERDLRSEIFPPGLYLDAHPADVVLLHIGTNDLEEGTTGVEGILDHIDAADENVTVVLAQIINRDLTSLASERATTSTFNQNIGNLAQSRIANGDKIILVDMENDAGIDYRIDQTPPPDNQGDMWDDLHPNYATVDTLYLSDASGYNKIAGVWYDALVQFLPQSSPPVISSAPVTRVNWGDVYRYNVESDSAPITYSLTANPPVMTIDPDNGQISWSPDSLESVNVTVQATNWLGTTTQEFEVKVSTAPRPQADIPGQSIVEGGQFVQIYLDGFVEDDDDPDTDITWTAQTNELKVAIVNRVATVSTPDANWNGSETITFRAADPGDLSYTDTAVFTVSANSSGSSSGSSGCFIHTANDSWIRDLAVKLRSSFYKRKATSNTSQ